MFNSILLAFSVSIDSLGIGITYGIRNAKIKFVSRFILFIMSVFFSYCSFAIGYFINSLLSEIVTRAISSGILIIIGIIIILDPIPFDLNHSKAIDIKEALLLGTALSLDSVCIGIGYSIGGHSSLYFPLLVAIFQLIFMSLGMFVGKKIIKNFDVPDKFWNIISGVIIIIFGVIKLLV